VSSASAQKLCAAVPAGFTVLYSNTPFVILLHFRFYDISRKYKLIETLFEDLRTQQFCNLNYRVLHREYRSYLIKTLSIVAKQKVLLFTVNNFVV
jgi:hypothetical protein